MIKGKVARILSENEVVINVGENAGVEKGMKFVIFSEGEHIFDPDTKEDLGVVETIKGRIVVTHVMEKMSRARTDTYQVNVAANSFYAALMSGIRTETRRYTLEVNSKDVSPMDESTVVVVGDTVRTI